MLDISPVAKTFATMRILSGIQPSGRLHLGNYFGMMEPAIRLQDEGEAYYFIADYHSLTSIHDPSVLRDNVRDVAIDFLACGLDPGKAVFFRQSDVPEVTELTWILSTLTPMGLLERCHSYKDKIAQGISPSHGLFAYPVLMAADILIYNSELVPVGKDQKQHIEVTRDLAQKFNDRYGEGEPLLHIPEPRIAEDSAAVPGLDGRKMSKSYNNTIGIFEDAKALKKKVMRITTDSTPMEDPKNPDDSYIIMLYQLVATADEVEEMKADFRKGGQGYGHFKKQLLDKLTEYFAPMREKRDELANNDAFVEEVLQQGAKQARIVARETLDRVRKAVGL
ncbi:MAG: tryptophan--tRNA ligase [Verrucomicrobiales bacterium]|nr:tryptophan--tRNA ligase [Verrucomicrobiales bacterium]